MPHEPSLPDPRSGHRRISRIVGLGTDIVEVARIVAILAKHPQAFAERHFTEDEQAYCTAGVAAARAQRFAARFAAKEATAKALGTGLGEHAGWREIEVVRTLLPDGITAGPPTLRLHGSAERTAARLGINRWMLSLAHEHSWATATVLALHES